MSFCLVKNGCAFGFSSLTLVGLGLVSIVSSVFSSLTFGGDAELAGDTTSSLTLNGDFAGDDSFFAFSFVFGVFFLVGNLNWTGVFILDLAGVFFDDLAGVSFDVSVFSTFLFSFSFPGDVPGDASSCFTVALVDFRLLGGDLSNIALH